MDGARRKHSTDDDCGEESSSGPKERKQACGITCDVKQKVLNGGLKKISIDDARKIQGIPSSVRNGRRAEVQGPKGWELESEFC